MARLWLDGRVTATLDHSVPQVGAPAAWQAGHRGQVSYDDGRTWRPAPVHGSGPSRTVTVHHPKGGGFVSLRAYALDSRGNAVEQTTIRAYALRG